MAKKKAIVEETPKSGGRGKKICPSCSAELGARTAECPCGYKFQPKTTSKKTGSSLKDQLEQRLAEIDQILASKDSLEVEQERIQSLLQAMGDN